MTHINYFIACQEVLANEKDQIIRNPYMLLTPLSIPGNFSFTLAIGVFDLKPAVNYLFQVNLTNPEGNITEVLKAPFISPEDFELQAINNNNGMGLGDFNLDMENFEFYKTGVHIFTLNLYSAGELVDSKEVSIIVVQKTPSQGV